MLAARAHHVVVHHTRISEYEFFATATFDWAREYRFKVKCSQSLFRYDLWPFDQDRKFGVGVLVVISIGQKLGRIPIQLTVARPNVFEVVAILTMRH